MKREVEKKSLSSTLQASCTHLVRPLRCDNKDHRQVGVSVPYSCNQYVHRPSISCC